MTLSKKHASSEVLSFFFFLKKNIYKAKNVKAIPKSKIS